MFNEEILDAPLVEVSISEEEESGVFAISMVDSPAIEEDFVFMSKQTRVELQEVDKEKRIVMGPALVPNKPIYRHNGEQEYYIFFKEETIRKASQQYLQKGNQANTTIEHQTGVEGVTVVESWLIEDETHDKSKKYGFDLPVGTWMVSMKVENEEIWENFVKTGKVKGFSIEAYLTHSVENLKEEVKVTEEELEFYEDVANLLEVMDVELESYTDYPKQVTENAKIALRYAEENGWGDCGTPVGKQRANQLAKGEPISEETIARMAAFARHRQNGQKELGDGCGRLSWLAWGGDAGVDWAIRKMKQLREE